MIIEGYQLLRDEILRQELCDLVLNTLKGLPLIPSVIFTKRSLDGSIEEGIGLKRLTQVFAERYNAKPISDFRFYTKAEDKDTILYLDVFDEESDRVILTFDIFSK